MRGPAVVMIALASSACFDFVEPDLAIENADAVLQVTAFVTDNGTVTIDALFVPGIEESGFQRQPLNDTLGVLGLRLGPTTIRKNGSRVYSFQGKLEEDASGRPFEVLPPFIEGVPLRPAVTWPGIIKLDSDTIVITRGEDLVLNVRTTGTVSSLPPNQRWGLELAGNVNRFNISADSELPDEVRVPSHWIPAEPDSVVNVSLQLIQSADIRMPGYRGLYNHSARVSWLLLIR